MIDSYGKIFNQWNKVKVNDRVRGLLDFAR